MLISSKTHASQWVWKLYGGKQVHNVLYPSWSLLSQTMGLVSLTIQTFFNSKASSSALPSGSVANHTIIRKETLCTQMRKYCASKEPSNQTDNPITPQYKTNQPVKSMSPETTKCVN